MRFEKGNNLGGRKTGSVNKITQKIREAFSNLINDNLSNLQEDIDYLEPKDRLRVIIDLAGYVIPKMKAVQLEADIKSSDVAFLDLLLDIDEEKYEQVFKDKVNGEVPGAK